MLEVLNGTRLEQVLEVAKGMRQKEKEDFLRIYPSEIDGLLDCCLMSTRQLCTVKINGETMGILGMVGGSSPEVGIPWLAMTEEATHFPVSVIKLGKSMVAGWRDQFAYIYNYVPADDLPAIELLEVLGFHVNTETVIKHGHEYRLFMLGKDDDQCA